MMLPSLRSDQQVIFNEINKYNNIVCICPRGTGKTTIGRKYALENFLNKPISNGVYVCHKKTTCRETIDVFSYNILVNPMNIDEISDMGMYGRRFQSPNKNFLDVLPLDKFQYASGSDYMIFDELDVITEKNQVELFKMFSNYNTQQRIIFTSLAYKSFMDNLNNKTFGPYKVVKL